jgi:hypothetical protein
MAEMKPISVNVRFLSTELATEAIVAECSICYALVIRERLEDHVRSHYDNQS